ncbi:MAG: GGDEF domain-containing protein, partial [Planctomycetota bacterium]
MDRRGDILLLADPDTGSSIAKKLPGLDVRLVADPYQTLAEASEGQWGAVLLSAPRPDLAGLCRAIRRLQPGTPIYALTPPTGEPELRAIPQPPLDDYYILPLTPQDTARIRREVRPEPEPAPQQPPARPEEPAEAPPPPAPAATEIPTGDLARAIGSTDSAQHLRTEVARIVSDWVLTDVRWVKGTTPPADTPAEAVLLRWKAKPRQLLLADPPDAAAVKQFRARLDALQELLPALAGAAERAEKLHHLAIADHLTGAFNRRYLYEATEKILRSGSRSGLRASLLLFDIDNFKQYN